MTEHTIRLDRHRGMAAQKATEVRRLLAEVEANQKALRERQEELESQLIAAPAASWSEAAAKARYLLRVFAATPVAQDPRRQTLIASVLDDFARLSEADGGTRVSLRHRAFGLIEDAHREGVVKGWQQILDGIESKVS